jgi:hypothetical protein
LNCPFRPRIAVHGAPKYGENSKEKRCNKGVRTSAAAAAAAAGSGEYRVGASRVCDERATGATRLNLLGVSAAVLVQFSGYLKTQCDNIKKKIDC